MASLPPPLPMRDPHGDAFDEPTSLHLVPVDVEGVGRGAWVVASGGPLGDPESIEAASTEPDSIEGASAQTQSIEADLTAQVARTSAQLQLALGRLAGIHAAVEGIEGALAALGAAGDCPTCRNGDIRSAVARLRALAGAP